MRTAARVAGVSLNLMAVLAVMEKARPKTRGTD